LQYVARGFINLPRELIGNHPKTAALSLENVEKLCNSPALSFLLESL
jgi:hypothetical protein